MKDCAFKLGASLALAVSLAPAAHAGPVEARSEVARDAAGPEGNAGHESSAASHEPSASEAQALFTRAIDLYTQGDYRAAAQAFLHTYTISGEAAVLFNVAQCYRQLSDCDGARNAYRAYRTAALKSAEAEAATGSPNPESAVPETWPAEFIATCGEESLPAAPPPASTSSAASTSNTSSATPPPAMNLRPTVNQPAPPNLEDVRWPAQRVAGWTLVGFGAASALTSLGFAWAGSRTEARVNRLPDGTDYSEVAELDAQGRRENAAAIALGAAAAVVTGVGLFLLISEPESHPAGRQLGVSLQPGTVSFQARF